MSGRRLKINQIANGMPQVDEVLSGWQISFMVKFIKQVQIDGEFVDRSTLHKIYGVLQPLKNEELQAKPEGQRAWKWYWLHVQKQYPRLPDGYIITINDEDYKVMASKDYTLNGYNEYHLLQDYKKYGIT